MKQVLHGITINSWQWHLRDEAVLPVCEKISNGNFNDFHKVKANKVRVVFSTVSPDIHCFIKHEFPDGFIRSIRNSFSPRSEREFESALMFEGASVPVVNYAGWGNKGSECVLLSRTLENASNAHSIWFDSASLYPATREAYIRSFSRFLKLFLSSRIFHPDFHLGNLMVKNDLSEFCIVDPYGAALKSSGLTQEQKFELYKIVGAMRGELSFYDAATVLISAGMETYIDAAITLWEKIIRAEAQEMENLWEKRKDQVLSGNSKYCLKNTRGENTYYVRKSMSGIPVFNSKDASAGAYESIETTFEEGEKLWLQSFRLQFHRIPHKMPLGMKVEPSGRSKVYFRKEDRLNTCFESGKFDELMHVCTLSGIDLNGAEVMENSFTGLAEIVNIKPVLFKRK